MSSPMKTIFSREVDCVLPRFYSGSTTMIVSCGLSLLAVHDAARCLLKIYLNRKNGKSWFHHFRITVAKKLILGKLVGGLLPSRGKATNGKDSSSAKSSTSNSPRSDSSKRDSPKSGSPKSVSLKNHSPKNDSPKSESPKSVSPQRRRSDTEVLFFPDSGIPCKDFYGALRGCSRKEMCPFLHEETAYLRLLRILKSATKSIDVCVFCLTCGDLGSTLIAKSSAEGVGVRVVTDSEQLSVSGSQIGRLRREGVLVRHDNSSYLMHHKFAIIDEELLINGSFNWTRTAITGNHENLVISRDENMVKPFISQFAQLWELFHPDKQTGFERKPIRQAW